jgi:hypothetical protein
VTRGAGWGRLTGVGVVTLLAALVAGRHRGLLADVAGAARGRPGEPVFRSGAVTRGARGMSGVGAHELHLALVASGADGRAIETGEVVRLMTLLAPGAPRVGARLKHGNVAVAGRAGCGDPFWIVGVGLVARHARRRRRRLAVLDVDILVAALAGRGSRGRIVRHVTARADRVSRNLHRRERRLLPVAANARRLPAGLELVRLVASRARVMARRLGTCRLRVARGADRHGRGRRRVRSVAIRAPVRPLVPLVRRGALLVTLLADRGRREGRRRLVQPVALGAVGRCVRRDGREGAVGLAVAVDACRGRPAGRKDVAGQAIGGERTGAAPVPDGCLLRVALAAYLQARLDEALLLDIVAVAALGSSSVVRPMAGARPVLFPYRRHVARKWAVRRLRSQGNGRRNGGRKDGECRPEAPQHTPGGPLQRPTP